MESNLPVKLRGAYECAKYACMGKEGLLLNPLSEGAKNAARSKNWVFFLGETLFSIVDGQDKCRLFTLSHTDNRAAFGFNELLYDICIVKTSQIRAAVHDTQLPVITSALWQVESEFKKDSKAALIDFNKLIIGNAKKKLFIGPIIDGNRGERYRETLAKAAYYCSGECYLAMVPHPSEWEHKNSSSIQCWAYVKREKCWDELK